MSSILFRLAEKSDNDGILDLARRCPQEGMITFYVNRTPRFNTLHRLLDPDAWHYVACTEDRIIGLVGVVHFQAMVLGVSRKIAYMLDLRLDEAYRSGTTAWRLVKKAIDHLYATNVELVIANFVRDNQRSLVFTSGRGGLPGACYLGRNRILNLIPLYRLPVNHRFVTEQPEEKEIPEMVDLLRDYHRRFKIAPFLSEKKFRHYLELIDGFSLKNFLVARENGKIKAVVSFWDEHAFKSYQVLKLTPRIIWVNRFIRFLSLFMKVPHPIVLNQPLRQLSLAMYGHRDCPEALETLFRQVINRHRGSAYTLVMLMAQETDPVFSILGKFLKVSVHSEMYLFARDTKLYDELKEHPGPVLFDLAMIL